MFEDQSRVLKHLNHPASRCRRYVPSSAPDRPDDLMDYVETQPPLMDQTELEDIAEPNSGEVEDIFEGAARILGLGKTFMDRFNADPYSNIRKDNIYYPFTSRDEWELASFLLRSGMSMATIDEFLGLRLVSCFFLFNFLYLNSQFLQIKGLQLSFHTAKALRGRAELLPKVPEWKSELIKFDGFPTKDPMDLYYRDTIECVKHLFGNPLFDGHMDYQPR
jgi:hypothetical protein